MGRGGKAEGPQNDPVQQPLRQEPRCQDDLQSVLARSGPGKRGLCSVSARSMTIATRSGGLPALSLASNVVAILRMLSAYKARPSGGSSRMVFSTPPRVFPTAGVLIDPGSTTETWMPCPRTSSRSAALIAANAAFELANAPPMAVLSRQPSQYSRCALLPVSASEERLNHLNLSEQVDLVDCPQRLARRMFHRRDCANPGVVDDRIQPSSSKADLYLSGCGGD